MPPPWMFAVIGFLVGTAFGCALRSIFSGVAVLEHGAATTLRAHIGVADRADNNVPEFFALVV